MVEVVVNRNCVYQTAYYMVSKSALHALSLDAFGVELIRVYLQQCKRQATGFAFIDTTFIGWGGRLASRLISGNVHDLLKIFLASSISRYYSITHCRVNLVTAGSLPIPTSPLKPSLNLTIITLVPGAIKRISYLCNL